MGFALYARPKTLAVLGLLLAIDGRFGGPKGGKKGRAYLRCTARHEDGGLRMAGMDASHHGLYVWFKAREHTAYT
jgi:hypothetical protein